MSSRRLTRRNLLFLTSSFLISFLLFLRLPFSPSLPSSYHCISYLHNISWSQFPSSSWSWDKSVPCIFRRFSRGDSSEILRGGWILVAGDSQARLMVLALLRVLLEPDKVASVEPDLFKRHSDYHIEIHDRDIKIDFIWAPYESNITHLLQEILLTPRYPNILILGSGLWHMLHFTNPKQYGNSLSQIKQSANLLLDPFDPSDPFRPKLFWLGLPNLVNSLLNTNEKKQRMNSTILRAYERETERRDILEREDGPFFLIDFGGLSKGCGIRCTLDGMHYDRTVYEAAVNILLNSIVYESRRRG
ncbi:hypothetical protein LUZ60_014585 [Juncus effusus]|nr:hypothetical protein LUZ60_014585 [Juncus effusus]